MLFEKGDKVILPSIDLIPFKEFRESVFGGIVGVPLIVEEDVNHVVKLRGTELRLLDGWLQPFQETTYTDIKESEIQNLLF